MVGSTSAFTSTIVLAGRMSPKTSPCALPTRSTARCRSRRCACGRRRAGWRRRARGRRRCCRAPGRSVRRGLRAHEPAVRARGGGARHPHVRPAAHRARVADHRLHGVPLAKFWRAGSFIGKSAPTGISWRTRRSVRCGARRPSGIGGRRVGLRRDEVAHAGLAWRSKVSWAPTLRPGRGGRPTVTLRVPGVVTTWLRYAYSPSTRLTTTGRRRDPWRSGPRR